MRWILLLVIVAAMQPQLSLAQAPTVAAETGFPGCEWRPAADPGPPGRWALFCKNAHGLWLRVDVPGLEPDTAAKAAAGDVHATAVLGVAYLHPNTPPYGKGRALIESAAAKGDPVALSRLGQLNMAASVSLDDSVSGGSAADGAARSARLTAAGLSYSRQAAAAGDVAAMLRLAVWLKRERPEEALDWSLRAAEAGDSEAMRDAAARAKADLKLPLAEEWLLKAASADDVEAMRTLANDYRHGFLGKEPDASLAKQWDDRANAAYVQALKVKVLREGLDIEPAWYGPASGPAGELGMIYLTGRYGIVADPPEGLRWLGLAAEHGDAEAAVKLARLYEEGGDTVAKDQRLAAKWRQVVKELDLRDLIARAERGNEDGMLQLASLYILGHDDGAPPYLKIPKDPKLGAVWLLRAAAADPQDAETMMMVSGLYRKGLGVEKNAVEAQRWRLMAVAADPQRFGGLDEQIAVLDKQPGFAAIMVSRRLFGLGRRDEASFWYYVGQLRGRMEGATDATAGQAYGAIFATYGPTINEYVWGDLAKFSAMVDNVLAWDDAHPMSGVSPTTRAEVRKGLVDLRSNALADETQIRRERAKNGLPNAPSN